MAILSAFQIFLIGFSVIIDLWLGFFRAIPFF